MLLGGNALLIRTGSGRFTRDVDLAREEGWESPAAVVDELRKLLAVGKGKSDFAFILKSITPHAAPDDDGYGALTAKLQAEATLGGATFEKFSIDLTTRRHADAPVDQVALKRIINDESLNGLPKVPTIPVENHLADKVCALYEKHGVSGKGTSTRYRDLADIVRIIMA
ncbi:nucleotidyl transferase AbiEii/AbiGii toxin family protein, partial [Microbacterium sp.]|uniref:nucleotidyl transferase AbiEii/AbiGii toxin family protein n=1 Tax=Microbacterium sp. TaxID=51671 RepID=UPI003F9B7F15